MIKIKFLQYKINILIIDEFFRVKIIVKTYRIVFKVKTIIFPKIQ